MSTGYVTEFGDAGHLESYPAQPPVAEQTVSYTTSTQSSAFNKATSIVRVSSGTVCSVAFGTNPSATTSKMRLAAGQAEYFRVPQGADFKVAFIDNT